MSPHLTESVAEEEALRWFAGLDWTIEQGTAGEPGPHRETLGQVVLLDRLREAVDRINAKLPAAAREEAARKVLLQDSPTLIQ